MGMRPAWTLRPARGMAPRGTLHLVWDGEVLLAWGEQSGNERLQGPGVPGMPPLHPRAVSPGAVLQALGVGGLSRPRVQLLPLTLEGAAAVRAHSARCTVPAVALSPAAFPQVLWPEARAAGRLLPLAAEPASARTPAHLGEDALGWRRLARLAVALAARGGFVPGPPGEGDAGPRWLPLPNAEELRALEASARGLPAEALAPGAPPSRREAAEGFLAACLDAWVRWCLLEGRGAWARTLRATQPAQRWFLGLLNPVPLPERTESPLRGEISRWVGVALVGSQPLCGLVLRLGDPEAVEGAEFGGRGDILRVPLAIEVQLPAADGAAGPLVPIADLWREGSGDPAGDAVRRQLWRQAARQALQAAARLWPPLAEAEGEPPASVLGLSVDEAESLADQADALEQQGIRVRMPAWWREEPAAVRATLHLEDAPGEAGGPAIQWTRFRWQVAVGGQAVPPEVFEELVAGRRPLVRLGRRWIRLDRASLEAVAAQWQETGGEGRVPVATALRLALEAQGAAAGQGPAAAGTEVAATGRVGQWLARLAEPRRLAPLAEPPGFAGTLRPYQRHGLGWMAFLAELELGGCLADDMGLGKTVQVIALLLQRRATGRGEGPSLLVAPTSVLGNWQAELRRFAPSLVSHLHYGADRPRGERLAWLARQADVVVTSYALLHRDARDLRQVAWDGVILDEAQNVKNPVSLQAQAARALPARYRFALTGTPVENSLRDLWSIFAFALPGYLGGGKAFTREYAAPLGRGDEVAAARLRRSIAPFLLRRTKRDPGVADELPPKIEWRHACALSAEQAALYEAFLREAMQGIEGRTGMARRAAVLTTLLRLKQICDHPSLFTGDAGELAGRAGKLDRLEELLAVVVAEGDSALVFTQFASWARRLSSYLGERLGCEVPCLDGSTPAAARSAMVRRFQQAEAPQVLVLSLKAGGTGLNLTAAQHVFHYDRWWNPAVEEQATDRAYRIGQRRSVQVHRLIAQGTLEEHIDALLQRKAGLAQRVVGAGGEAWVTELSTEDLRALFALRREAPGG
jgi:superfamily II DNA or RNA helicase